MTPRPAVTAPRRRRRRIVVASLIALLLLGWWLWPDGRLARARALQQELFAESAKALPPEERRAKFEELRQTTRAMSSGQRQELSRDMMTRRQADLERYATMTPAEKRAHLDREINRQEEMVKRMQAAANRPRPAGAPPGGGQPGGPGGFGGPGGGDRRPTMPEERERRRRRMLDATTPQFRALTDQHRKDLAARRQQRGLPPTPPGRGPR
jgi:hypothetical protein